MKLVCRDITMERFLGVLATIALVVAGFGIFGSAFFMPSLAGKQPSDSITGLKYSHRFIVEHSRYDQSGYVLSSPGSAFVSVVLIKEMRGWVEADFFCVNPGPPLTFAKGFCGQPQFDYENVFHVDQVKSSRLLPAPGR